MTIWFDALQRINAFPTTMMQTPPPPRHPSLSAGRQGLSLLISLDKPSLFSHHLSYLSAALTQLHHEALAGR